MHFGETPQARSMREANEREQRNSKSLSPVTWTDVLGPALISTLCLVSPFWMHNDRSFSRWSPWPEALSLAGAIAALCTTVVFWRGVRKGWTDAQAESAAVKVCCWVFGLPIGLAIAIAAIVWLWTAVSGALGSAPWWALVIIVLLIALVFK